MMRFRVKIDAVMEAEGITAALLKIGAYYTACGSLQSPDPIYLAPSEALIERIPDEER